MASVDDLKRAREEFLRSSLGQYTRRAWMKDSTPGATDKQRRYLFILYHRLEDEVEAGRVSWPEFAVLDDEVLNQNLTIGQASSLIDKCRRLLREI